jgi:hypothetical protein
VVLQKAGKAAFVILTEPFADQIQRAMAYQRADRELPAIVVPHPIQNISPEEFGSRAEVIADAAEQILRGDWDKQADK